jgi:hypothetical protein
MKLAIIGAGNRAFDGAGDKLALGVEAGCVIQDRRHDQGPVLHGSKHVFLLFGGLIGSLV